MNIKTKEKFSNDIFITELHEVILEQKIVEKSEWQKEDVGRRELASLRRKSEISEIPFQVWEVAININNLWD